MRKKFALLLAGAMTLSALLSACGSQAENSSPAPAGTPDAAASVRREGEPAAEPDVRAAVAPDDVNAPAAEPSAELPAEPFEEPVQSDEPLDTASAAPQVSEPTPAPAPVSAAPDTPTPPPAVEAPAVLVSAAPPATPESTPEPTPEPATAAPTATREDAVAFIGRSVSSLIGAIGQPLARNYAPSCLGEGEDGELLYDGFTVYTYREGDTETVQDVI